jgi:DNA polymerase-3 subunit delta'
VTREQGAGAQAGDASVQPHDAAARRAPPTLHPWHETMARAWLARRDRWPHALLLTGSEGIGKRDLALVLAQALLCEAPRADGFACGACPGCGYVAAGAHPDLRRVEPFTVDDDEVKPLDAIPVGHVRALGRFVQVTAHRRVAKVAIVAPAERLNIEAANALLKTLEEPPAGTYLILVAHQPGRLPATIASRCVRLALPTPDAQQALAWLEGQGVAAPSSLLAQAGGAPLLALTLAQPALQSERRAWLDALAHPRALSPLALSARIEAAPRDERKSRLGLAIDWLTGWSTDLARVAAGGAAARNTDYAMHLDRLAPAVARVPLSRYHRSLLEARARLSHPLAPRLVAEALLIDYRALFTTFP